MRYFITGGAGFIGSQLAKRLLDGGHRVTAYDNLSSGKLAFLSEQRRSRNFRLIRGDVRNEARLSAAMAGHDFVFHLATNSNIMAAMNDPSIDFNQGIHATFAVLEAMRKRGVRRLAYTSGSGVYGDRGRELMKEPDGDLHPISMYGAAKLASEGMISAYSHLYGIQAWVFRPANIIGPKPTHGIIYDLVRKLAANPKRLDILGDGTQTKSYIHVDDFLDGVLLAVRKADLRYNVFNIASRTSISVRGIVGIVLRETGRRKTAVRYAKENRGWKGDVPVYKMSIAKLLKLGWRPRLDSEEAVTRAAREILAEGKAL
jgi:UDP-glucose 4-epimerase